MTCNMAACYRKRPVDDKSDAVDFKGGRNFGDQQRVQRGFRIVRIHRYSPTQDVCRKTDAPLEGRSQFGSCSRP